ncbi:hypothetical protein EAH_00068590, partial [Eimeria acervulina]
MDTSSVGTRVSVSGRQLVPTFGGEFFVCYMMHAALSNSRFRFHGYNGSIGDFDSTVTLGACTGGRRSRNERKEERWLRIERFMGRPARMALALAANGSASGIRSGRRCQPPSTRP